MNVRMIALALATAALSTSAMAAPVTAKLSAPLSAPKKPVAGGSVWNCEADACFTASPGDRATSVMGCRELVRSVGALAAYGTEAKPFTEDKLAACNGAKK